MTSFLYRELEAHDLLKELVERYVLNELSQNPHAAILEVGAGNGNLLRELVQRYNISGCGTDPFILEREEPKLKFLPLKAEEIEKLPRRYNLIYSVHSLHHFNNPKQFFEAASKKLSWGGKIVIVDWNRGAKTGIPEHYYDAETVASWATHANLKTLESGTNGQNFFSILELKEKRVAIASSDGKTIFRGMFGQSPYLFVYTYLTDKNKLKLARMVKNKYDKTLQHLKTYDVYDQVSECQAIIAKSIGKKGQERLNKLGVRLILNPSSQIGEIIKLLNS